MITELKKTPQTYPYPHKFHVKFNIKEFIETFSDRCEEGKFLEEEEVSIAGRITNIRSQSKKLIFYDIIGEGCKLQIVCNLANHKG